MNKFYILLNTFNQIKSVSLLKENKSYIEIQTDLEMLELCNYKYVSGTLIYSELKGCPNIFESEFDGEKWVVIATLEEQIEYYKNLIIEKTRELGVENLAGFGNPSLELELNELKKIHLEKSHELALQIENRLKEV